MDNQKDLVVLVPDKDIECSLRGILSRWESLSIRPLSFVIYTHPERDPGCRTKAHDFLSPFARLFSMALVVFDREGCGQELARDELEQAVEEALGRSGWQDRCAAVVIDPEIEAWVWSDSPHVEAALGWQASGPNLRTWLQQEGHLEHREMKPRDPKKAMVAAMRYRRKKPSSSVFTQLARNVSFRRCQDPAFQKLKTTLTQWFGK